mgnify:CR=1 FL=1
MSCFRARAVKEGFVLGELGLLALTSRSLLKPFLSDQRDRCLVFIDGLNIPNVDVDSREEWTVYAQSEGSVLKASRIVDCVPKGR